MIFKIKCSKQPPCLFKKWSCENRDGLGSRLVGKQPKNQNQFITVPPVAASGLHMPGPMHEWSCKRMKVSCPNPWQGLVNSHAPTFPLSFHTSKAACSKPNLYERQWPMWQRRPKLAVLGDLFPSMGPKQGSLRCFKLEKYWIIQWRPGWKKAYIKKSKKMYKFFIQNTFYLHNDMRTIYLCKYMINIFLL